MSTTTQPRMGLFNTRQHICGCWYASQGPYDVQRSYLPIHSIRTHTTIQDVTSRTTLTQTFRNNSDNLLENIAYSFPLYDGVSVVSFDAVVGSVKIHGIVKEKQQARQDYKEAIDRGSSAALFEQLPESSDIFTTSVGNVPAGETVTIDLVYIGELKYDTETGGTRFTIPASIAPRYGNTPHDLAGAAHLSGSRAAIDIVVDVQGPEGCQVKSIQSPSHHINVTIGRTATMSADAFVSHCASATLSLNESVLDKDFIIIANVKDADKPKAFLETHPTYPNQRALMATLVPKFNLPPKYGEIVFIVDRSGSMGGKIDMVIKALTILLKSLPVGVKFNICSFGSHHSFLWPKSKSYTDSSVGEALRHVATFNSNLGGTEMYAPVQSTITQNYADLTLDAIILTDGQIWNQDALFSLIRTNVSEKNSRFFSLGIDSGASTALIEGIAASGNGISQFVTANEKMDKKMVRLLKAALTPRINDVKFELRYKEEDFEMIDSPDTVSATATLSPETEHEEPKATMSFYNEGSDLGDGLGTTSKNTENRFAHLPAVAVPSILQAPHELSSIYLFSRLAIYLMLDPETRAKEPTAVVLRASSEQGPIELEIRVEDLGVGQTIHQLAAKKAIHELEKGQGWLTNARDPADNALLKTKHEGRWDEIVEREAVRLGLRYQISGKWCSFIAVDAQDNKEHEPLIFNEKRASTFDHISHVMSIGSVDRRLRAPASGHYYAAAMQPTNDIVPHLRSTSPRAARAFIPQSGGRGVPAPGMSWNPNGSAQGPVPIAGMQSPRPGGSPPKRSSRARSSAPSRPTHAKHFTERCKYEETSENRAEDPDSDDSFSSSELPKLSHPTSNEDKMDALIRLQNSNGSWNWTEAFEKILGPFDDLPAAQKNDTTATTRAVSFFKSEMADEKDTWELIVEKASLWLAQQGN
ncbi:VIT-domain-containing protein [Xylariaceae sp. FL1272]|nr:VIT-domain-containing protein [Xylariaceae sp. FL1272]